MASDPVQPIVFGNLGKKRQGQRAGNDKINFLDKTRVTEKIDIPGEPSIIFTSTRILQNMSH